jgi:hypothetical protein
VSFCTTTTSSLRGRPSYCQATAKYTLARSSGLLLKLFDLGNVEGLYCSTKTHSLAAAATEWQMLVDNSGDLVAQVVVPIVSYLVNTGVGSFLARSEQGRRFQP